MSANTSSEELRRLLANDQYTPSPGFKRTSLNASSELSSLLSSLAGGLLGDSPVKPTGPPLAASTGDEQDFTVLNFGVQCSLRSRLGRYLTAVPTTTPGQSEGAAAQTFALGVEGQGVGDPLDALVFVNAENREDTGPLCYGAIVAVKAPAARERLLGTRDASKLGFWRNLVGQGEKWMLLRASAKGVEEPGSRGSFVRAGDALLLASPSSASGRPNDELLSLYEGAEGRGPKLVHVDRAGLGDEVWRLDLFASQPLPSWHSRVYLSGNFLCKNTAARQPPADAVTRTFPGATAAPTPSLAGYATLPPSLQQRVLVRELLLALSGIEGDVVRVMAAQEDTAGRGRRDIKLKDIALMVNAELTGDRSLANHVAVLLPMCEVVPRAAFVCV